MLLAGLLLSFQVSAFHLAPIAQRGAPRTVALTMQLKLKDRATTTNDNLYGQSTTMKGVVVPTGAVQKKQAAADGEEGEDLMQKVKDAGSAGIISYIFWEWAFWGVSVPIAISAFYGLQGHFPDFSNSEDL